MQQITIEMIETKEFRMKARGYDQDEVDTFLDEICDEMERQLNTISKLQQQLKEAQLARPAASPQPTPAVVTKAVGTDDIREMLEMAQRIKNETVTEAQKKADTILSEARAKAEEQLGDLAGQRTRLVDEVTTLKTAVADYRQKFTELLNAQKAILDEIEI